MKRIQRSILGVTLLEIMLVLAIAAMVIVMSIRYYQSSTSSQQANAAMQSIQAIAAAMDNISNGGAGTYSNITQDDLKSVVGSNNMISPTNVAIELTAVSSSTYSIQLPLNTGICDSVRVKLAGNSKITSPTCTDGILTYTYDSTK